MKNIDLSLQVNVTAAEDSLYSKPDATREIDSTTMRDVPVTASAAHNNQKKDALASDNVQRRTSRAGMRPDRRADWLDAKVAGWVNRLAGSRNGRGNATDIAIDAQDEAPNAATGGDTVVDQTYILEPVGVLESPALEGSAPRPRAQERNDRSIDGSARNQGGLLEADAQIEGRADRTYYLMMVAGGASAALRPPQMDTPTSLPMLKPQSRAECERRCGPDGFCDPSSILGCGGEHCGRQYSDV